MEIQLSTRKLAKVKSELRNGRKIAAIKLVREYVPGTGLRESKDFVDGLNVKLNPDVAKQFATMRAKLVDEDDEKVLAVSNMLTSMVNSLGVDVVRKAISQHPDRLWASV